MNGSGGSSGSLGHRSSSEGSGSSGSSSSDAMNNANNSSSHGSSQGRAYPPLVLNEDASPFLNHHSHHQTSVRRNNGVKGGPLLKHQLKATRSENSANPGAITIKPIEEELSFDKGFFLFIRALQLIASKSKNRVVIVGVAGPSGSGKTVFSEKVAALIPGCRIISMDMYNDASRLVDGNFDDPRLTDYELLIENIERLRSGKPCEVPIYDFKTSSRIGYRTVKPPSSRIVIVEGIYALTTKLRDRMDLRVSITGGVHFDLVKRVLRDISRSGQQPQEIIQQISETVYPMYKAFIEPDLKTAQIRIYNDFNPFSGFQNPTYTLKSAAFVPEEKVQELFPKLFVNRVESEFNDIYLLPPNEDPETCSSWLRMRNRNGRYELMFEEWVKEGDFVISPGISFEVNVRILGGLLALGYSIYLIMQRKSVTVGNEKIQLKWDNVVGLGSNFIQIQGKSRCEILDISQKLGLQDSLIPYPYIEQVQLQNLTQQMRDKTEHMLRGDFSLPGLDDFDMDAIARSPTSPSMSYHQRVGAGSSSEPVEFDLEMTHSRSSNSLNHQTMPSLDLTGTLNHQMSGPYQMSPSESLGHGRQHHSTLSPFDPSANANASASDHLGHQQSVMKSHSGSATNEPNGSGNGNGSSNEETSKVVAEAIQVLVASQQQTTSQIAELKQILSHAVVVGGVLAAVVALASYWKSSPGPSPR
mmetsp:Transcript_3424/g.8521  ORF Transcript_3424/g.8521 Transcript_3424/m.8521 type:complete len:699 (+) Transcript_3424:98-2194(+)